MCIKSLGADIVRHLLRQHQRHLHQAGNLTILIPGLLIDQLLLAVLLDGVGIGFPGGQQLADLVLTGGFVAIVEAGADQSSTTVSSEGVAGFGIHFCDDPVFIADGDRYVKVLDPLVHLEFLEQVGSYDSTLDLIGSFVNLQDLGIPHHLLHGILFHIAIAA